MEILDIVQAVLDVGIVTFLVYKSIMVVKGTRAMEILKGTVVILIVWGLATLFGFETLKFIISQLIIYGLLGMMIIFQPELRNALEKLGRNNYLVRPSLHVVSDKGKLIDSIVQSSEYMSKRRIGALMSIQMEDSLSEYSKTGIEIDAKVSKELLINIFTPNVPLHDGALIITNDRLEAGSCYLPLSESTTISKELGTRHRAAIGLSEVTDALTVVISEETGGISITKNNKLLRGISLEELRNHLELMLLDTPVEKPERKSFFRRTAA